MYHYVIHKESADFVFFISLKKDQTFSANDTFTIERFEEDQLEEAKARAIELGYEFDPLDV